jgi:hypothetical protein
MLVRWPNYKKTLSYCVNFVCGDKDTCGRSLEGLVDSYPQVSPPSSCYPENSKKRNNVLPEAAHYRGGKGSWKKKASSPLESSQGGKLRSVL